VQLFYLLPGAATVPLLEPNPSKQAHWPVASLHMPWPEHSSSSFVPAHKRVVSTDTSHSSNKSRVVEKEPDTVLNLTLLVLCDVHDVAVAQCGEVRVNVADGGQVRTNQRQVAELSQKLDVDGWVGCKVTYRKRNNTMRLRL